MKKKLSVTFQNWFWTKHSLMKHLAVVAMALLLSGVQALYAQPAGYEPVPSNLSITTNGDFSIRNENGTVGGGIQGGQNPATTVGTNYPALGMWSQAQFFPQPKYVDSNDYNGFTIVAGPLIKTGATNPPQPWFTGALMNTFPGDPAFNVQPANNYLYSNGNAHNGGEYVIWGQTLTNLVVERYYTFSMYVNNAIEPPEDSQHDPIVRLRMGGTSPGLPNGNVVAGPLTLTEVLTASTNKPLGGWVRLAYTFQATNTTEIFKVTSAALGVNGDDFQMTQVQVVQYGPILNLTSNSPVCLNGTIQLTASTPATGTMTYAWSGPLGFTSSQQNPIIPNATFDHAGTYTCRITDTTGSYNEKTVTVVVKDCLNPTIKANPDYFEVSPGGTSIGNVLSNDFINTTTPATLSNVTLTQLGSNNSGVTLNSNGTVTVAPGTAPGTYQVYYSICSKATPTDCSQATAFVTVRNPALVDINKTATPVIVDGQTVPNTWDITLSISPEQIQSPTDIVVVIDKSSSMSGTPLAAAKAGAVQFVRALLPNGTATQNIKIALITFDGNVTVVRDFTNDLALLESDINGIVLGSGTFTQGGLRKAREILQPRTALKKHVVLLSDGEPTLQYKINTLQYPSEFIGKASGDPIVIASIDLGKQSVNNADPITNDASLVTRKGFSENRYNITKTAAKLLPYIPTSELAGTNKYYLPAHAAIDAAQYVKNRAIELHTIGFNLSPLAKNILRLTASSPAHYYEADNNGVAQAFQHIAGQIGAAVQAGVVEDVVAPGFNFDVPDGDITTKVTASQGTVSYNKTSRKITWTVGEVISGATATLKYRVTYDMTGANGTPVKNTASTKGPDPGGYDTNTSAGLTYTNSNDEPGNTKTYPKPTVKPGYGTIERHYVMVNGAGQPIKADGTVVTDWAEAATVQVVDYVQPTGTLPGGLSNIPPMWIPLDKNTETPQNYPVSPSSYVINSGGKNYRFVEVDGSTVDGAQLGISWTAPRNKAYFAFVANNPPVAVPDVNTTHVDTPVSGNVLTNDFDPDGDPIKVTPKTNEPTTGGGTVTINADGSYTYVPKAGFTGEDTFKYTVCDNFNDCATTTVTIDVTPLPGAGNNPPVAIDDNYVTNVGTTVNGNVIANDFDPDGNLNPNGVTLVNGGTATANGTLNLNPNGTFTYTPNAGFSGTVSFTYQVCDTGTPALCDDATVTIIVLPTTSNTTVAVDDAFNTKMNKPVSGSLTANDYDPQGDTQTINILPVTAPANGTVVINPNGTFTYTPNKGFTGTDQFVYSICDNGTPQACDKATAYIAVDPVNNPPVALPDINTTFVDTPVTGNVLTNDFDPDGDPLKVTPQADVTTSHGKVTVNADGTYTYTPNSGYTGEDTFTYEVCDNQGNCTTSTVTINVLPLPGNGNNPPVAINDNYKGKEGKTVTGQVLANDMDPDSDPLTVTAVKAADGSTIPVGTATPVSGKDASGNPVTNAGTLTQNADGTMTFEPSPGFVGTVTYEYTNSDGTLTDDAVVTIIILPDNSVLNTVVAVNDAATTPINTAVSGNVLTNDYDPQGNTMTVTSTGTFTTANGGTVVLNTNGTYTYTPKAGFTGEDTFTYTIEDNGSPKATDQATVTITVTPTPQTGVNNPPVAQNDGYHTNMNTPLNGTTVLANDSDPDAGQTLTPSLVDGGTAAKNGTLVFNADGTFTFTPNDGFTGQVSFVYQVCDNGAPSLCDVATVTIDVIPPTTPTNTTVAVDDAYIVPAGSSKVLNVKANDYDPEGHAQGNPTVVTSPAHGTVTANPDGTFTYTPNAGYTGTDQFVYSVCDNGTPKACDKATVYLNVTPINNFWMGSNDPASGKDWNTNSNWTAGVQPFSGQDVIFATVENNNGNPAVNDLVVPVGDPKIAGNLVNNSDKATVVPPSASLTVNGTVTGSSTLQDAGKLVVQSSSDGITPNGTLIAKEGCSQTIYGTVQLYAKGYKDLSPDSIWNDNITGSPTEGKNFKSTFHWQHFGVPVEKVKADPTFHGSFLREYDESFNGDKSQYYQKWHDLNNGSDLVAFQGYEITQYAKTTYNIAGKLQFCDKDITLTRSAVPVTGATGNLNNTRYGLGQNIFGNSYTASIEVSSLNFHEQVEPVVYLYNTGRFADWGNNGALNSGALSAGQYTSIPRDAASVIYDGKIPSMNGFLLIHRGPKDAGDNYYTSESAAPVTMTLPYLTSVKPNSKPQTVKGQDGNTPTKAGANSELKEPISHLRINLSSKSTVDNLWLISRENTTAGMDEGWDGRKFFGTRTAYIFTENQAGLMQVNTDKTIDGSVVSFYANDDTEYTLTLMKSHLEQYENLHLFDFKTRTLTPLSADTTVYTFTADNHKTVEKRFLIVNSANLNINSGELQLLDGYLKNNNLLVISNFTTQSGEMKLFDASGRLIKSAPIHVSVNEIPVDLQKGVYILRMHADGKKAGQKIIIR